MDEITAHGFRTMASTRLNEMGFLVSIDERREEALEAIRTWAVDEEAADAYWSNFSLD